MVISFRRTGLITGVLVACFLFMYLVANIPAMEFNATKYTTNFLPIVAIIFVATALIGSQLSLKTVIPILLIAVFLSPLSNVTASGWYNVPSSGLLFGTLFQFRPKQLSLKRNHYYLFGALIILGAYYNVIPALFGDNDGFNNKLWLYNFSTFLKYIYISLLFIQVRPSSTKLLKYANWFAVFFAFFVILEAFHVPTINIAIKTVSQIGYRPLEISRDIALHYFRAAGLGIDANHAAIRLAILLPIALYQVRHFKYSLGVVAMILIGIYLTGSRSGFVLMLAGSAMWFAYGGRWLEKYQFLFRVLVISFVFITIANLNPSFAKVSEIATGRYTLFISGDKRVSDKSFLFRQTELTQALISITPFGDRTDHLATVHSELGRLIRFYGFAGIAITVAFWGFYFTLVRRNYIAATLVFLMFLNAFWKWTFHIEAFFIPTIITATMYITERKDE